jgi:hypothetical protein
MKYFLIEGKVFAYESDGSQDHLIREGAQTLTEQQAIELANPQPTYTQRELDELRYKKRAEVKDQLIAWMAADNMSRVRAGQWTVADLTGLIADPALQAANAYMATLSYEMAAQAIAQATNPLMTPAIKSAWVAKLTDHFYLVP